MMSIRTGKLGLALAVIGAVFAVAHRPDAAAQQSASGDALRGKQLFYDHACYGCHGYNGETGARDLVGTGSPIIADVAVFTAFLRMRADLAPLYPSTRMPSFPETSLSDSDARDIFAYIQTFELDAPAVEDVPALRAILESAAKP